MIPRAHVVRRRWWQRKVVVVGDVPERLCSSCLGPLGLIHGTSEKLGRRALDLCFSCDVLQERRMPTVEESQLALESLAELLGATHRT